MAVTNLPNVIVNGAIPDSHLDMQGGRVLTYPEGTSQSFKAGDFVILSSGVVIDATPESTPITGPADIFGIAMEDATGTAGVRQTDGSILGSAINVYTLKPGAEVILSLADLSAVTYTAGSEAATGNYIDPDKQENTTPGSVIGATVSVVKDPKYSCKWVANINSGGTNKTFQIIGTIPSREGDKFVPRETNGTVRPAYGGKVICRVLHSALQNE